MKIYLGADHGGFELKEEIKTFLKDAGYDDVEDCGTNSSGSVDYPRYAAKVAQNVVLNLGSRGILVCGTGIGVSIAANKIPGARAALCTTATHARLARQHNNANIIALGGRITGTELAKDIVKTFLENEFEGGRHEHRIGQITELDMKCVS